MATLQKIRNKAGFLVFIIGIALLAFIIGDFINSGQAFFRMAQDKVVVVNGKKVTTLEFSELVNRRTEELQNMFRQQYGMSLPEGYSARINKDVFDQLVQEMVISDAAAAVGIEISKEEMADMLQGDHIAPQIQQMFSSKAELLNFLQVIFSDDLSQYPENAVEQIMDYRTKWLDIEQEVKKQRISDKYLNLLLKTMAPNKYDLQASYENGNTTVAFDYALQPYTSVSDGDITISDEEISAAYNKEKNRYKQDAHRTIKYITVEITPSEADDQTTGEKIDALRETFSSTRDMAGFLAFNTDVPYSEAFVAVSSMDDEMKNFVEKSQVGDVYGPFHDKEAYKMYRLMGKHIAPDSVKVRYIMFPLNNDAATTLRIDSIFTELKKGSDFNEMALQYSADRNSGQNGGEIGWISEVDALQFGQDFNDFCFNSDDKGVARITSPYGIHLVQVTERQKPVEKANVAQLVMTVRASSETYNTLYNKLNQYIANNNKLEDFESNAANEGLLVNTATVSTDDVTFGKFTDGREIIQKAFNSKKGRLVESKIFNIENNFVAVMVSDISEKGYMPKAAAEPYLRQELLRQKKGDKISADLQEKNPVNIDAVANIMNSKVEEAKFITFNTGSIAGLGSEFALIGAATSAEKGKLQGPIAGNRGVYMFTVTDRRTNDDPIDVAAEGEKYNQKVYTLLNQFMTVLKEKSDIEDNRIKFY
ncbi:MAG: SurA N-terminal domain-containing protein [Porphyromonadaceae bacterium]|nr:SurA N-terminal domain-containing protein [Porphyromonadaceae bacterium]